jgi:hypothetical protein
MAHYHGRRQCAHTLTQLVRLHHLSELRLAQLTALFTRFFNHETRRYLPDESCAFIEASYDKYILEYTYIDICP